MGLLLACIFQPSSAYMQHVLTDWKTHERKPSKLHLEQAWHYPNQFVRYCMEETSKSETHWRNATTGDKELMVVRTYNMIVLTRSFIPRLNYSYLVGLLSHTWLVIFENQHVTISKDRRRNTQADLFVVSFKIFPCPLKYLCYTWHLCEPKTGYFHVLVQPFHLLMSLIRPQLYDA